MALAQRLPSSGELERGAPALPARAGQSARPLHAGRPREYPCQVVNMSPGGMALIAPVTGTGGRARHRLCRPSRPARRQDRAHVPERLRDDRFGDAAQARQARRPAHVARQPPHAGLARRPPPRPLRAEEYRRAPDHAERRQSLLPHHRHVAVRRRRRDRPADRRSARWSRLARCRAGSCAISKTASPSSSPGCSTRTSSKTTSPAGKRRAAPCGGSRGPERYPVPR